MEAEAEEQAQEVEPPQQDFHEDMAVEQEPEPLNRICCAELEHRLAVLDRNLAATQQELEATKLHRQPVRYALPGYEPPDIAWLDFVAAQTREQLLLVTPNVIQQDLLLQMIDDAINRRNNIKNHYG